MPLCLEEKYEVIYAHEENFAYALGKRIVKKPEVSVWMILLPILFVHHIQKVNQYKSGVQSFARGILSSKQKALDKAYREVSSGQALSYGPKEYFPDATLETEKDQVLAKKQIKVIRIMEEHYMSLLNAGGDSLEDLLRQAYQSPGKYRSYLERLKAAEQDLNQYLVDHIHTNGESSAVVRHIEKNCDMLREEEIKRLFF